MSDITREEAIKILKDTLYDERTPNNYIQAVRMGREALENQKAGHWKIEAGIGCKCSCCGFDIGNDLDFMEYVIFCPYCGAKMEGENNETDN